MAASPIDTVKRLLRQGKAYALPQFQKENGIQNIEGLIDAAAKKLQYELPKKK
jgi:hypothetical protein